jgi:hypothetical protein
VPDDRVSTVSNPLGDILMRSRSFIAVFAVSLAALALACSSGSSTTSGGSSDSDGKGAASAAAVTTVKVGETLALATDFLGTKTKVDITVSNLRANVKAKNQFEKASNGQYIVIDVVAVVKEGKVSINSSSFKLVAADGTAYNSTIMTEYSSVSGMDLAPGQKTSGAVVFDAKPGAQTGGKIALTDIFASGDAGYWTI